MASVDPHIAGREYLFSLVFFLLAPFFPFWHIHEIIHRPSVQNAQPKEPIFLSLFLVTEVSVPIRQTPEKVFRD